MTEPIEPYEHGMLDVGDGQLVYWEQCGNPEGTPLVFLHGGPGGGCSVGHRRIADSAAFRLVLFDQRGCGRSRPHVAEPGTGLEHNTTEHLIADLERLREHLGIDRWLVFGASWGSSLGLAYAERFPERVSALVVGAVFLTRPADLDWLYGDLRRFLPIEHQAYRAQLPEAARGGSGFQLVQAYDRLLDDADPDVRQRAADAWLDWEDAVVSLDPGTRGPNAKRQQPEYRLAFARLCAHYFSHAGWFSDNELFDNASRLRDVPGAIVHGRVDPQGSLETAWQLSRAWPAAELTIVEGAGHTTPALGQAFGAALDRFRR